MYELRIQRQNRQNKTKENRKQVIKNSRMN